MNHLYTALEQLNSKILEIQDLNGDEFSFAAEKAMQEIEYKSPVTDRDLLEITHKLNHPRQYYGPKEFGEYNLTVFYHEKFSIQVYLMNQIDTEFHDHGFVGAFQLLKGENAQTCFEFVKEKDLTPDVEEGKLNLIETKVQKEGDTYPLKQGVIHQISRLAESNITLMVMKNTEPKNHVYLPPKIKVNNDKLSSEFIRKLYALDYEYTHYQKFSEASLDFFKTMSLMELLYIAIRMANFPFATENKKFILEHAHKQLDAIGFKWIVDEYLSYIQKHKAKTDLIKS